MLYEGVERVATKLDQQFRKPAEGKVRAMLLNNYFAPALASSHAKLIDVVVWTTESAESLQARLDKLGAVSATASTMPCAASASTVLPSRAA